MNQFDFLQIIAVLGLVIILTPLLGKYFAKVFLKKENSIIEQKIYQFFDTSEMNWKEYLFQLLSFNFLGLIFLFLILKFQNVLPLNPDNLPSLTWDLALNTAISFITNTNWQAYGGEGTLSHFSQMVGLTVQNFLSAAVGIAVLLVLIRGLVGKNKENCVGNFWVDLVRSILYILLPLSFLFSLFLVGNGVIQNFNTQVKVETLEGAIQIIPQGPVASQESIKMLGTNGGGYFNTNSAHPYENPTPLTNFFELVALLLIPSALVYMFGIMVGNIKEGWSLWGTMMFLLVTFLALSLWAEFGSFKPSMEGIETRFGISNSVMWSVFTTATSNGSVNAMHSSLSPLSGGIAMLNIMLGEIVFGGLGSGLYGMILMVILTVFLSGLMVGRTPEYLGKKIEAFDIQMTIFAILVPSMIILLGAGLSLVLPIGLSSLQSKGPHGLSEVLYAFSSAAGNNGSAFAGLNANTVYYNLMLGLSMLLGRFCVIIPVFAIAGNMLTKKISPPSFGTFTTDNLFFAGLLIAVILIVGALTFFPSLALGPIAEHFLWRAGQVF